MVHFKQEKVFYWAYGKSIQTQTLVFATEEIPLIRWEL